MENHVKIVLAIFVVFGIMLALFLAYNQIQKEKFTQGTSKVRICLFYAEWCPHCTKYLESGVFESVANDTMSKRNDVVFETIDYEQNKNLANKYDINGFPTIVSIDANGNKIKEFQEDRYNATKLQQFALESLVTSPSSI